MKFYDSLVFLLQISTISLFSLQILILPLEFYEKRKKKPLIGFEPMTYALPWRYSTTELKGPRLVQFLNKELATMSLVHIFITAYTYSMLYYMII